MPGPAGVLVRHLVRCAIFCLCGIGVSGVAGAGAEDPYAGAEFTLPSGERLHLLEVIDEAPDDDARTLRLRFVMAGLSPGDTHEEAMLALCERFALPLVHEGTARDGPPAEIIVSISDRAVPFGETAPEATQIFAAFHPADDHCILTIF